MSFCLLGYDLDVYGGDPYGSPLLPLVLLVDSPTQGMNAPAGSQLIVSGIVTLGATVWVNGQEITVSETGDFTSQVFVLPGLNVINVQAGCDTPLLTVTRQVFGVSPAPVVFVFPDGGILSPGVYPLMEESA